MATTHDLQHNTKYAITWDDDPKEKIVVYLGVDRGFLVFQETTRNSIIIHCRPSDIHIRCIT